MDTILGLLLLGVILAVVLGAPDWLARTVGFLFSATLVLMIVVGTLNYIGHRSRRLRAVHYADGRPEPKIVDSRTRWAFGTRLRRRFARAQRTGAVRIALLQRAIEAAIVLLLPIAFAIGLAGLRVESRWLSIALVLGTPVAGLMVLFQLAKLRTRVVRKRKQVRARDAAVARRDDPRRPILFLRSFRMDERAADAAIPADVPPTFEAYVLRPLERFGPVIAIGRPDEALPPLGAHREYVSGRWEERVRELLDEAALIVAILDDSPGLLWEIGQVFALGLQERLLLVVPDVEQGRIERAWRELWAAAQRAVTGPLDDGPESASSQRAPGLRARNTLAVVFEAGDRPLRIIGRHRYAEYVRDAVRLGALNILSRASR